MSVNSKKQLIKFDTFKTYICPMIRSNTKVPNEVSDIVEVTISANKDGYVLRAIKEGYKLKFFYDTYLEWLFYNSKDENMIKAVSLITGWEIKTDEQLKATTQLLINIKKLMSEKNMLPNELSEKYGKKSNEMTDEELKEVINWLEQK